MEKTLRVTGFSPEVANERLLELLALWTPVEVISIKLANREYEWNNYEAKAVIKING